MRRLLLVVVLLASACSGGGDPQEQAFDAAPIDVAKIFTAPPVALGAEGLRAVADTGNEAAVDALAAKESARWAAALAVARAGDKAAGGPGTIVPARFDGGLVLRPAVGRAAVDGGSFSIGAAGAQMVTLQGGFGKVANPSGEAGRIGGARDGVDFGMSVDKAGGVSLTLETKVDLAALFLSGGSKASIRGTTCPDANGKIDYTVEIRIDGKGKAATYGRVATAHVTATTNDQADIVEGNAELVSEITTSTGKVVTAVGQKLGPGGAPGKLTAEVTTTGDADEEATSTQGYGDASSLAQGTLAAAESHWKSGSCIAIRADSPGQLQPGSTKAVPVAVTSTVGNGAVPAKVTIALSGGEKVDKAEIAPAPGSFTYTAPNEKDKTATIELKATSKQGRATKTLTAGTKAADLRVSGPFGFVTMTGTKCGGPEGTWKLRATGVPAGTTVVLDLTFTLAKGSLTGALSGNRNVSAAGHSFNFPVTGQATYDPVGGKLTISSDGGTASVPVTEGSFCTSS